MPAIAQRIRERILTTISNARVGHPGGSMSAVEILTSLYFHVLRVDPERPDWPERDRFVLSKGHASSALYATLAERGFFPPELLSTFGKINSRLQVHPDMHKVPGVEISTGALGQGLSVGVGMALAARADYPEGRGRPGVRIYVLLGDGECQEGQVWEAVMAAAHYKLDNLTAIVDYNQVQLSGPVAEVMEVAPLADKWRSFGWAVEEVPGHDIEALIAGFDKARGIKGRPTVIIARTVKGKGVSFMEGKSAWHGKPPDEQELKLALEEVRRSWKQ
ncbi:MAG TPA: transketolase [Firmicutes bacterium]|nr:transketolase [Bacillota bacterium]